jgi:hypothetical protein
VLHPTKAPVLAPTKRPHQAPVDQDDDDGKKNKDDDSADAGVVVGAVFGSLFGAALLAFCVFAAYSRPPWAEATLVKIEGLFGKTPAQDQGGASYNYSQGGNTGGSPLLADDFN